MNIEDISKVSEIDIGVPNILGCFNSKPVCECEYNYECQKCKYYYVNIPIDVLTRMMIGDIVTYIKK